jgi:hypothetical protein
MRESIQVEFGGNQIDSLERFDDSAAAISTRSYVMDGKWFFDQLANCEVGIQGVVRILVYELGPTPDSAETAAGGMEHILIPKPN